MRCLAALAPLAGPLVAQTFIVDDDGGPGVDFTDIPAAVAAVPSGSVLRVRAGTYSVFAVANKSLSILGDDRSAVIVTDATLPRGAPGLVIGPIGFEHTVILADLQVRSAQFTDLFGFNHHRIRDAHGPVVFARVTERESAGGESRPWVVERSSNVHWHEVSLPGGAQGASIFAEERLVVEDSTIQISGSSIVGGRSTSLFQNGYGGLSATRSRVLLVDSTVQGSASFCPLSAVGAGAGGTAVLLDGSTLLALACSFSGGDGAVRCITGPTRGGHGVDATNGSSARCEATTLQGGAADPPAAPGQPARADASSTLSIDPTSTPALGRLVGTPAIGNAVTFSLTAKPGSAGRLILGLTPLHTALEPIAIGSLLLDPLAFVPLVVPASGTVNLPFTFPVGWPLDVVLYAQFGVLEPDLVTVWASNSFPWFVRTP